MTAQFDAVKEATDAFTKLFQRRNWLLGAPTIAGTFLILVVFVFVVLVAGMPAIIRSITSSSQVPDIAPSRIAFIVVGVTVGVLLAIAVSAFTYAWTLAAAEPVWGGHDPAFDRGFNRAASKLLTLVAYLLLVGLMSIVSLITIVGPIIIWTLAMYGPAYILFGERSATRAIADSFRLASENLGPTVILVLAFIVIYILGMTATLALGWIPVVGAVIQIAFSWIFSAYVALAIVRFYDLLSISSGEPPFPIVPQQTAG